MHLVTWNVHTVTGSNSPIHSNHRTSRIPRYCCPNHCRSPSMLHSWNQEFIIIGFCGRSAWCWVQRDGQLTWPCYVSNHQPSRFYHRHTVFFTFYCCWICEALVRLFVLKQRLQGEYWVLLSTLLRQFSDLQTQSCSMYRDPFHLVLVFGHSSSQLTMSSHDLCVVTTLRTAALDTANEVAVWSQTLQLNAHQQSDQSPILHYFHTKCYQTQSAMHWHWHYTA